MNSFLQKACRASGKKGRLGSIARIPRTGSSGASIRFTSVSNAARSIGQLEPVSYLETTFSLEELQNTKYTGYDVCDSIPICHDVGNTPLVHLEDEIYAKLEGHNPGGSLKDRTISSILLHMFEEKKLRPSGETICLVTSGSAGVSLRKVQQDLTKLGLLDFNVVVVIPKAYCSKTAPSALASKVPGSIFEDVGGRQAQVAVEDDNKPRNRFDLIFADGVFIDVLAEYEAHAKELGWSMLEQHYDANSMKGHRSTAKEIMMQCPDVTDIIVSTGTGATAAGLRNFMPDHVRVHSRPAESGTIDGLTNVQRYNNFCDSSRLVGYNDCVFDKAHAEDAQKDLEEKGIVAGPSSGATLWLARQLSRERVEEKRKFLVICADGKLEETSKSSNGPQHARRSQGLLSSCGLQNRSHARMYSTSRAAFSEPSVPVKDYIVVGGGPVGASTAWFLSEKEVENEKSILLIHDPKNKGAHEDWSRLARLSFDGPIEEMELSRHAVELLDLLDEVQSMNSGAPIVPLRPGMLFLASPGTNMARVCAHGESYGDKSFVPVDPKDLESLFPGNKFSLPPDTLCWTHPTGLCVSPLELASAARKTAEAYGAEIIEGRATIDALPRSEDKVRVTLEDGRVFDTPKCFLFAGAQNKTILKNAIERDPAANAVLGIPEFDETYITAISTIRYKHVNHPANPAPGSGHVPTPITLGQLEIPGLIDFQANFSIVAEEYGDVLKTRLSGSIGSETIESVADMHNIGDDQNAEMAETYQNFFGNLFPFLDTEEPLDFNRCVTYRNHNPNFSGTSILEKKVGGASILTTPGCFGVGVKFGPALGEAATAHVLNNEVQTGMNVFQSGSKELETADEDADRVERAW